MDSKLNTEEIWKNIHCPICNEKRKNTKKNKVWFDNALSDRKNGKMIFYCTNHDDPVHFMIQLFIVKDVLVSVKQYVFHGRLP